MTIHQGAGFSLFEVLIILLLMSTIISSSLLGQLRILNATQITVASLITSIQHDASQ
ncbi:MAG: hypothetical protein Tsb005_08760 [Gammaproteobacteria bacterium]